jgi:hypothetical protein
VSEEWFDWIDGLAFEAIDEDQTLIRANLPDRSALHGLLKRIGDMKLTILSIKKATGPLGPGHQEIST